MFCKTQIHWKPEKFLFLFSTVHANVGRTSAGTVMTKFRFCIYIIQALALDRFVRQFVHLAFDLCVHQSLHVALDLSSISTPSSSWSIFHQSFHIALDLSSISPHLTLGPSSINTPSSYYSTFHCPLLVAIDPSSISLPMQLLIQLPSTFPCSSWSIFHQYLIAVGSFTINLSM